MDTTDLHNHPIEGFVPSFGSVSIPLISQIKDNLWTGGCIDGVSLPADFKFVLSLYPWEQYKLPEGCERREERLYDSATLPDKDQLYALAKLVVEKLDEGPTLVHCQAGLNRSGLIAGLALTLMGHTAQEAIDLLREKRSPAVLCNVSFASWLLNHKENDATLT